MDVSASGCSAILTEAFVLLGFSAIPEAGASPLLEKGVEYVVEHVRRSQYNLLKDTPLSIGEDNERLD